MPRHIERDRPLTDQEAAHLDAAATEAEADVDELLARRQISKAAGGQTEATGPGGVSDFLALNRLVEELRAAREAQGLSLADIAERTGLQRAAVSKLENRHNLNPTIGTLSRYAAAVGRQVTFGLAAVADVPESAATLSP